MTVTTTFTTSFVKAITISSVIDSNGSQGSLVSLSNGNFGATYANGNSVSGRFLNSDGENITSIGVTNPGVTAANPAIAYLTNGNGVFAFQDTDSIVFQIMSPTAGAVTRIDIGDTNSTNPDVAALAGGGFVIVSQDNFSATDNDIDVSIRSNAGAFVTTFSVDASNANDTNAKVVGLADGGFAVTWQRLVGTSTQVWSAVYNANGTVRKAPALFDSAGTINENPDILALSNGGFAVVYADNGWGGEREITYARFDSAGTFLSFTRINDNTQSEFQPTAVQLSNGIVAISYHDDLLGDTDPLVSFVDGNTGALLSPTGIRINSAVANEDDTSIAALKNGQFVVSWHNATTNDVVAAIHQSVRLSVGDAANDTITGYQLVDNMQGNGGNDTLEGRAGADILNGGAGTDIASYIHATAGVRASLANPAINTGEAAGDAYISIESLAGSAFNDTLVGDANSNVINGRQGADQMTGGAGDDSFFVDNAGDKVFEAIGGGTDRIYTSVTHQLQAGAEIETLSTTNQDATTALNLVGNNFDQTIVGNAGANVINGLGGVDTMRGLGGNDRYYVDNTADIIVETSTQGTADRVLTSANYSLKAGVGIEILSTTDAAGIAALKLAGNSYANTIVGNAGNNFINGGAGADTLTGLGGNDIFMFNTALGSPNVDTITDYNVAQDTIRLENAIFTGLGTGTLLAEQFVKNATGTATDANDRIIYETDTGRLIYDSNGSAAGGAVLFAKLAAGLALTANDFFIV